MNFRMSAAARYPTQEVKYKPPRFIDWIGLVALMTQLRRSRIGLNRLVFQLSCLSYLGQLRSKPVDFPSMNASHLR